ncbi:MAG: carboxypeptidase regulatory-like domain-containing protein [Gemmatimonadota bacterium]
MRPRNGIARPETWAAPGEAPPPSVRGALPGALLLFLAATAAVYAQEGSAVLRGTVTSADTGEPLAGAVVTLVGSGHQALTSESGRFSLSGLPAGASEVQVTYLGHIGQAFGVNLVAGSVLQVDLSLEIQPVEVHELRVEVEGSRRILGKLAGFYERREKRQGYFLTSEDLERLPSFRMGEVLRRLPSVEAPYCRGGQGLVRMDCQTLTIRGCNIDYIHLDGAPIPVESLSQGINEFNPREIAAVEVYTTTNVPAQFGGINGFCGALVLWTKSGPRGSS